MPWANFDTENERETLSGPGVCMAMTCHWIRRVFESNRNGTIEGLSEAGQLRMLRHHVQHQSQFESLSGGEADDYIFAAYRLRGYRSEHRATTKTLLAQIRSRGAGMYLFGALGSGGGHAMGIAYLGGGRWVFFDPNVGQRCFGSEEAFVRHLVLEMKDYSDLRDTFEIYHVVPRLQGG